MDDLTITDAMLWSGGTLGDMDVGAAVIVDGAAGRFDPPDVGGMFIGSTLNIISEASGTWSCTQRNAAQKREENAIVIIQVLARNMRTLNR